jgi:hypothetical protein
MTKVTIQKHDWEILPHLPYSPDLAPSDYHLFRSLCAEFPSTTTLSSKIGSTTSSRPNRRVSSNRGIENLPERWEAVLNNGEYIIDWLIICVKNKLSGNVKKPHELMHQPNIKENSNFIWEPTLVLRNLNYMFLRSWYSGT